jgi:hypothetical protein
MAAHDGRYGSARAWGARANDRDETVIDAERAADDDIPDTRDAELRRLVALHEAGHAVSNVIMGVSIEYASIRPGKHFLGVVDPGPRTRHTEGFDPFRPLCTQPAELRADIESSHRHPRR